MARSIKLDIGEKIRDLTLEEKKLEEQSKFEKIKAELQSAFAAPEKNYAPLTADDIFKHNDHLRRL